MNRIRGFLSGVRGRLARLVLRVGAIAFLVLLTVLLVAPDATHDFVAGLSWFIRGLILLVVYGVLLLLYKIPLAGRLRFRRADSGGRSIKADSDEAVLTNETIPGNSSSTTPEVGSEVMKRTNVSVSPETVKDSSQSLADDADESGSADEEEFWNFLRSTAESSEDEEQK